MKKIISLILCAAVVLTSALALAGCGDGNYPVKIANLTIEKEPAGIVVLDPCSADIISYMSYDVKIVGRSAEVDQKYLSVAPVMGTAKSPSIQGILDSGAEIVFANETLSDTDEQRLEEEGVAVIRMSLAETPKQLETNYNTIGRILGGEVTGAEKAQQSYEKLLDTMDKMKTEAVTMSKSTLDTVCYLYYKDNGLRIMTSGTYGDMLLSYTGAVNVAVNISENTVDVNTLRVANPSHIFYADENTLNTVKADPVLSQLAAVKNGNMLQITDAEMTRQGLTALETLQKMIEFIHPELASTPDEAATAAATEAAKADDQSSQTATQAATQAATEAAQASSLADKYSVKLDGLSLKPEDENDDVKAMQQRMFDLGYVSDKENITGYYGEISKSAVSAFQKANGVKETGEADNATLVILFSSDAKKADKPVDESSGDE